MTVTDKTATLKPPVLHTHIYDAADTVDDLNAWAISLFSPTFTDSHPAFQMDGTDLHFFDGVGFSGVAIPVGWAILFATDASIFVMAGEDFTAKYEVSA